MDAPPVQYVRTSDGYDIAYAVSGSGPPLVVLPWIFEHIQLAWEYPGLCDWLPVLAEKFTVVQLDARGSGMSSRGLSAQHAFADYGRDIEAVVNELALERPVLISARGGARLAVQYAANHRQDVAALILVAAAPSVRDDRAPALFEFISTQDWEMFLYSLVPRSLDPEEASRRVELLRQSFDQEDYVLRMRSIFRDEDEMGKLDSLLANCPAPTLLLHPRDYHLMPPSAALKLAQSARTTLSLIDGDMSFGDISQAMRAIDAFLAGQRDAGPTRADRSGLSQRETEVVRLVVAGKSNQEIADELVISLNTVRRHVSNIFDKTGTANRTEAAIYARDHGIT
jgi:pimeloyl-ACP methyl ester carboxylesterase/DNA-binding CsgD family transcriptional regulator